ncbi:MAG TPA: nucleotidyltransferase domain-containing protein [Bacteroidota bacterium]|nr:nucleotidyltransferase domain-containing protein [Bacteroidota bacterium]
MRITSEESRIIRSAVDREFPGCALYLFGSRADDARRGGDIDLLIVGDEKRDLGKLLRLKIELKEHLGDQKIDIIYQQKDVLTPFAKVAIMEGIRL